MNTLSIRVREVTPADLGRVVDVHLAAFPGFLMSLLGPSFLRTYYGAVLAYPRGIFLCAEAASGVVGFVAGFADPTEFYRHLQRRKVLMMFRALGHVARRPGIWLQVLDNVREMGVRGTGVPTDRAVAELASLGVHPIMGGRGLGKRLVAAFIETARAGTVRKICLTTDMLNNDGVNRFYTGLGFKRAGTVSRATGRVMNAYECAVLPHATFTEVPVCTTCDAPL